MAKLLPFHGLLPLPERAAEVSAVPYDVVNTEEAAKLAAEQAKLEDIKRKAEDKKFAAESAKKIAEGERVSQAAGGVD